MRQPFPLLPRKKKTDKSHYGHTLVVAGSGSMTGAALLASHAALVSGSGLVTLAAPRSVLGVLKALAPEVMKCGLPETAASSLSPASYAPLMELVKKKRITCVAIGPGLSQNRGTMSLVRRLVHNLRVPVVLDADGLNAFKGHLKELSKHRGDLVLTPHSREFERLFQTGWPEVRSERATLAKKLARFYDVVLVLKGHRTLVAERGRVYENNTGNPGMAKGGTGDVLAGIIASFISQGLEPFEAARWAVYFHGMAGDLAVKQKSQLGLLASHLIEYLPKAFQRKQL